MTILQKLKKECSRIGATLNTERWDITAPEGHVFTATQCHYIVFEPSKEDGSPGGECIRGYGTTPNEEQLTKMHLNG
jgi:hypothetical protein